MPQTVTTDVDVSWFREIVHLLSNQGIGIVVMVFLLVVLWRLLPSIKDSIASKSRLADKLGNVADGALPTIESIANSLKSIAQAHDQRNRKDTPAD